MEEGSHPETKYQGHCTQYWWEMLQTSRGGAGDTWDGVDEVIVVVQGGELKIG